MVFVLDALSGKVVCKSLLLARPSAKITELGGAKKVRRSGREAPKTEKRHLDWKFPSGGPEKGDFFPFFGVLGPPKPRPHTKNLQENGVL